jgi:hypothetical protein
MKKLSPVVTLFLFLLVCGSLANAQKRKTYRTRTIKPKVVYVEAAPKIVYVPVPAAPVETMPPVIEKAFAVGANNYVAHPVYVANSKRLVGRFQATGGGRNDIECLILDADGLTNFSNGNSTPTFYNSNGGKTVGNFDVTLAGDKWYYIVFKNYYWLGGKAVTLKMVEFGN